MKDAARKHLPKANFCYAVGKLGPSRLCNLLNFLLRKKEVLREPLWFYAYYLDFILAMLKGRKKKLGARAYVTVSTAESKQCMMALGKKCGFFEVKYN